MGGTTKTRRSLLDNLFGRKQETNEVSEAMAMLEAALDKSGVERKELDLEKTKGFLEKLVEDLTKVMGKISDDSEAISTVANEAAAAMVGALLESTQGTPIEDEVEDLVEGEVEEDVPTDTETTQDDEEEEELPEQMMELKKSMNALLDERNEQQKAMNEMIPAFITALKVIEELKPLTKEAGRVDGLVARMETIETNMKARPRAASSAQETIVENDDLKAQIKKGAEGQKTLLGFPVKPQ